MKKCPCVFESGVRTLPIPGMLPFENAFTTVWGFSGLISIPVILANVAQDIFELEKIRFGLFVWRGVGNEAATAATKYEIYSKTDRFNVCVPMNKFFVIIVKESSLTYTCLTNDVCTSRIRAHTHTHAHTEKHEEELGERV